MKNLTHIFTKETLLGLAKSIVLALFSTVSPWLVVPVYFLVEFLASKAFSAKTVIENKNIETAQPAFGNKASQQTIESFSVKNIEVAENQKEPADSISAEQPRKKKSGYKRSTGQQKPYNKKPYKSKASKTTQN